MRTRSASDGIYVAIAWLPFLAVIVGVLWVLATGVLHLEINSFGTEFFVGNDQTTNQLAPVGGGQEADLQAALDSGDTEQMAAALDRLDASQQSAAG